MSSVLIPPVNSPPPPTAVNLTVVAVCPTTVTLSWQWSENGCYTGIFINITRVDGSLLQQRFLGFLGYDKIESHIPIPCSCTVTITVRAVGLTQGPVSQPVTATTTGTSR